MLITAKKEQGPCDIPCKHPSNQGNMEKLADTWQVGNIWPLGNLENVWSFFF